MNNNKQIINFLKELRESADIMYSIFTQGSCVRLYKILKILYPNAIAYWSDIDRHCIIKIQDSFYDIGGEIKKEYIAQSYFEIPKNELTGYGLLKYVSDDRDKISVKVAKYK